MVPQELSVSWLRYCSRFSGPGPRTVFVFRHHACLLQQECHTQLPVWVRPEPGSRLLFQELRVFSCFLDWEPGFHAVHGPVHLLKLLYCSTIHIRKPAHIYLTYTMCCVTLVLLFSNLVSLFSLPALLQAWDLGFSEFWGSITFNFNFLNFFLPAISLSLSSTHPLVHPSFSHPVVLRLVVGVALPRNDQML